MPPVWRQLLRMSPVDGRRGELSVVMEGEVIAKKGLLFKRSVNQVLAIVRKRQAAEPLTGNWLPQGEQSFCSREGRSTLESLQGSDNPGPRK